MRESGFTRPGDLQGTADRQPRPSDRRWAQTLPRITDTDLGKPLTEEPIEIPATEPKPVERPVEAPPEKVPA